MKKNKKKNKKKKKKQNFLSDFFHFLVLKLSVYLNKHVFVMFIYSVINRTLFHVRPAKIESLRVSRSLTRSFHIQVSSASSSGPLLTTCVVSTFSRFVHSEVGKKV